MGRASFIVYGNVLNHFSAVFSLNAECNGQCKCSSGMGEIVFDDGLCILSDGVNSSCFGVHCHGQIRICGRAVTCGVDSGSNEHFLMNWKSTQVEHNSIARQCIKFDHVLDVKPRYTVGATAHSGWS